ncbi:MAG: protein-methionine-sulfoxide reductase catalytic subunit MsrP [Thioalkalispiraceae bacterium]|jgi:sulfoxide reductase catalytic subunit YedY
MLIKKPSDIPSSEITPYEIYQSRRRFIKGTAGMLLAAAAGSATGLFAPAMAATGKKLDYNRNKQFQIDEELTPFEDVTTYNNFYEFGTDKRSPAIEAQRLTISPWDIQVSGEINKPATYHLEDILKNQVLEERIYRFRCVERWSMVVPWIGFPLRDLIKRLEPTSRAKYIEFKTLYRPKEMIGQQRRVLDWPYVEGLRMDEALHPLTILAVGLYGEELPKQNGAPIRLIVPWKYGFKSIKSIDQIAFTEQQPVSSWTKAAPDEYGFYSNVNPDVSHPRWSQKRERRLGDFFKRKTLIFNGYADEVASLYTGMDLKKYY